MVLVTGEYRRHGLGTLLLKHCIAALEKVGRVPVLDATPAGRSIYRALGFEIHGVITGWRDWTRNHCIAACLPDEGTTIHPIADADWGGFCMPMTQPRSAPTATHCCSACVGVTAGRTGGEAARSHRWLYAWPQRPQRRTDRAVGRRERRRRARLSTPAPSPRSKARSISISPTPRPGSGHGSRNVGFAAQRPLTRMLLRRATGFDDTTRTFAVVGPEFG